MAGTPYLSEIRIFSFPQAPKGWLSCNGQGLQISQNQPLFALIGTTYGGDGRVTFNLPNLNLLQRVPMHVGNGLVLGQASGEANHTLTQAELPAHTHAFAASTTAASQGTPGGNFFAAGGSAAAYFPNTNGYMSNSSIGMTGGGQPHNNMSPFLVLNYCIATTGIFPSPNK